MLIKLKIMFVCATGGVALIVLLNVVSNYINHRPNGFIRLFPADRLVPLKHVSLGFNSFYIGGIVKDSIYLFNYKTPLILDKISISDCKVKTERIEWSKLIRISKASKISVDSNSIYLKDGLSAKIWVNNIKKLKDPGIKATPYYYAAVNLDSTSFALKVIKYEKQTALAVFNTQTHQIINNDTLLKPQQEGIFSTDGMLMRTPDGKKIIYLYYYRNQFMVTDLNLKLLYRGHTIDTISQAQIKVSAVKSQHLETLSSPPKFVNKQAFATNKFLFVKSALVANNEKPEYLEHLADIDVYDIDNGKYKFSFYLPDFGGHHASDFAVYGNKLMAIYDRYINIYKLRFLIHNQP